MKKLFILLLAIFLCVGFVDADSNYETDYTLIDCVNGDNDTAIAFDSTMPYATLKEGIENTISYINTNINKTGNEASASGAIFNIKVQCSFNDILNNSISLNYNGVAYNNEIIIEGIEDNSLIFKEVDFRLGSEAGNIIFKNAQFLNEDKPYFYDKKNIAVRFIVTNPISNGIKIIDSYIELKNGNNIGDNTYYASTLIWPGYGNHRLPAAFRYNYSNKQIIENSIIDIEIDSDFIFRMPVFIKDSQINFINTSGSGILDINFLEDGNRYTTTDLNYSVLVSNEIDLGRNNLIIEDTNNISFLNNNILNFENLDIEGNAIYVNNYFDNNNSINISNTKSMYNNIFKSAYEDSYDIMNYRKNYAENNVLGKGIGWVYKRIRDNKFFNIDISVVSLYKEIFGNDLPNGLGDIYVIFNY